ncbi:LOW QUALITY PROTEIN: wall-associated receptor kinase-like 14 [Triticum urartu]|uniref:LOW QUALITY PROTEIN: wall-associated receptor kinase-like 14 n=1 Tax=Triticum urartu TaxID=4572 RepID=UPI00204317DA|nr:LOW QUALITY PROTEIN: wall-associated receptor kinase-like 14 [Triticum urartu]
MRGAAGLPLPLLAVVVVVALLHAARGAGAAVGGGCDRRCGGMELPYPFGFSSGCTIRLGCDAGVNGVGAAWLGRAFELGLLVRNVTKRSIIVDLQPDCSRRFNTSVAALFSDSYAPSSGNSLIVSSCDDRANINNCSITPVSFMNRTSSHCSANESIRCIQPPLRSNITSGYHFLNRSELLRSDCTGLVSSISYSDAMGPAMLLGVLELDWWVPGRCRCSPGANCTQFTAPTTGQEAFRCECQDGLEGDGFIYGTGCRLTGTASSRQQRVPFGVFTAVTAIAVVLLVLSISACLIFRRGPRRNTMTKTKQPLKAVAALFRGELVDDELDQGAAGPRRFSYDDLAAATGNLPFSDDRALGRGCFGSVYQGFLSDMNREVAIKRVSETSRQGWKEFVSEVSIISRLRHRNALVSSLPVSEQMWAGECPSTNAFFLLSRPRRLPLHVPRGGHGRCRS